MGTARTIPTGRFDAMGRQIKESGHSQVNQDAKKSQINNLSEPPVYSVDIEDFDEALWIGDVEFIEPEDHETMKNYVNKHWYNLCNQDETLKIINDAGLKGVMLDGVTQASKRNGGVILSSRGGVRKFQKRNNGVLEDCWDSHLDKRERIFNGQVPFLKDIEVHDDGTITATNVGRSTPSWAKPGDYFPDSSFNGRHDSVLENEIADNLSDFLGQENILRDHSVLLDEFTFHNDHGGYCAGDTIKNYAVGPDFIIPHNNGESKGYIVEVDGGGHHKQNIADDTERVRRFKDAGYKVIRARFGQQYKGKNVNIPGAHNIHPPENMPRSQQAGWAARAVATAIAQDMNKNS